jgi:hypothetical protein
MRAGLGAARRSARRFGIDRHRVAFHHIVIVM